jgi:hypothetical protein
MLRINKDGVERRGHSTLPLEGRTRRSTIRHESPMPVEAANRARDEPPGVLLLGPFELTGCKKKQPRRQATTELVVTGPWV